MTGKRRRFWCWRVSLSANRIHFVGTCASRSSAAASVDTWLARSGVGRLVAIRDGEVQRGRLLLPINLLVFLSRLVQVDSPKTLLRSWVRFRPDDRYSEKDDGAGEVLTGVVEIGIRARIERGFDEVNQLARAREYRKPTDMKPTLSSIKSTTSWPWSPAWCSLRCARCWR
jgi:hypothetical protein